MRFHVSEIDPNHRTGAGTCSTELSRRYLRSVIESLDIIQTLVRRPCVPIICRCGVHESDIRLTHVKEPRSLLKILERPGVLWTQRGSHENERAGDQQLFH